MTEKLTQINLPGAQCCGLAEWGEETAEAMIANYRKFAARQKAEAEEILAADDADYRVRIVRGVHVAHPVRTLQEGRSTTTQKAKEE